MSRARSLVPAVCLVLGLLACGDDTAGSGGASSSSGSGGSGGDGSGGNPCFPDSCNGPSTSGSGGAGGGPSCPDAVDCGDGGLACDPTTEFCESASGGPTDSTTYTCVPLGACQADDCECLMEASPGASSCTPPGDDCLATVDVTRA